MPNVGELSVFGESTMQSSSAVARHPSFAWVARRSRRTCVLLDHRWLDATSGIRAFGSTGGGNAAVPI